MKKLLVVSALLLILLLTSCSERPMEPVQYKAVPSFYTLVSGVVYATPNGVPLTMDVYYPKATVPVPRKAAVFIHGGAWLGGSTTSSVGKPDFNKLTNKGYTVFSIDYRVGPGSFPLFIEDAKCAIRYLRANAAQYKINPQLIGVWGHSAGAHIAAMLALTPQGMYEGDCGYHEFPSTVKAVATYAGPMDLTAGVDELRDSTIAYIERVFGDRAAEGSPVNYVSADDPPLLAVHGDLDESISMVQSQRLVNLLNAAGGQAQFLQVKNGGHYLTVPSICKRTTSDCYGAVASPTRAAIADSLFRFFDRNLR